MEKIAMFGNLGLFSDASYFNARRYGLLYHSGKEHGLEFFAFLHADAYDRAIFRTGIANQADQTAYLDMLLERASHTRDVPVTIADRIVLLSTCSASSTNGRDILVGRITDELYPDTFEKEGPPVITGPNFRTDLMDAVSFWSKIAALVLLLILLAILAFRRKKKRAEEEAAEAAAEAANAPPPPPR
jgi:sortase B